MTGLIVDFAQKSIDASEEGRKGPTSLEGLGGEGKYCLFFFIDGTHMRIWHPEELSKYKDTYCNHKKYNSWSFFYLVAPNGKVVHMSPISGGRSVDATQWNVELGGRNWEGDLQDYFVSIQPELEKLYGGEAATNKIHYGQGKILIIFIYLFIYEFILGRRGTMEERVTII